MSQHHNRKRRALLREASDAVRSAGTTVCPSDLLSAASAEIAARGALHAANRAYRQSYDPKARELYDRALAQWREAYDAVYTPEFRAAYDRVRSGDAGGLEQCVAFLEADPYCHRSGYWKEELIRWIRRLDLAPAVAARLRAVIVNVVDQRDGREFRAYCRLARTVDSPELREALTRRLADDDPNVRRRAGWVLEACEQRG